MPRARCHRQDGRWTRAAGRKPKREPSSGGAFGKKKTPIPPRSQNQGFGPPKTFPKPIQNPSKIEAPKNMRFFCYFWLIRIILGFVRIFFEVRKTSQKLWFCCITSISAMCACRNIKQRKNIEKTYQKPFQNEVRTL